jgi:hypothetical protein
MNKCVYCNNDIADKTVAGKPRRYCNKSCSRKDYVSNNREKLSEAGRKSFETLSKTNPDSIKNRGRSTENKRRASKKLQEEGHFVRMSAKSSEVMLERYGDYFIRQKERETKIKNGKWIDYNVFDYDDVKKYTRTVRRLTAKKYGSAGDGYEWDHIVPISKAYIMGISPEKICDQSNIQKILCSQNRKKGNKITDAARSILESWGIDNKDLF